MALTVAECEGINEAAARAGVTLQLGFMRRFDAAFLEAKQGSLVVLYGSWDTVEVAVAAGNASRRLGVSNREPVHLERIHAR